MAIWYEVEKSEEGIKNFLESNWGFHDFRLEKVEYIPRKDLVEIFLKYDTGDEGVLLRFVWIHGVHINIKRDYDVEWISGSVALVLENNVIIWLDNDEWGNQSRAHLDEIKQYTTWVEAERVFWAITDANGNPINMPQDRVVQTWVRYGVEETKYFDLKEFSDNWDFILRPYYER